MSSSVSSSAASAESKKHSFETWEQGRSAAMDKCILPLSSTSHKGSSGRIGVIGGSAKYTGAPYYAAMASLNTGADLAFVFCADEASLPIKCYSPELMVSPIYSAAKFDQLVESEQMHSDSAEELLANMVKEVTSMMDRMHALIIGPGLGRCPLVLEGVTRIILEAQSRNMPLVLDADALFMVTQEPYRTTLCKSNIMSPFVLTPNVVEYKRLMDSCQDGNHNDWENAIICQKGAHDLILQNSQQLLRCSEEGGLKRSGGIGDILSGTIGTLVAWNKILSDNNDKNSSSKNISKTTMDDLPLACWTACCLTKHATKRAFDKHGRAMTAPDVLSELGPTVNNLTTSR